MIKLAIISSHPIQYYAPLFKLLTSRNFIKTKVFYTLGEIGKQSISDTGFGQSITWDLPLTEGYDCEFLYNSAKKPNSENFFGIINPNILQRLNLYSPDALLIFGWNFESHIKVMRHYHGRIPILFRGDSTLIDARSKPKQLFRFLLLSYLYKFVDKALYVGTNNKKYYLKYGLTSNQLIFAPHAVDNARFLDDNNLAYKVEASKIRHELGYEQENLVFIYIGKFIDKKDPLILIKSFKKIKDEGLRLLMVGSGTLEQSMKNEALDDPRIKFLGFINQLKMPVMYRVGDIFVLPSKGPGETWGLAVNESMASGTPVLVSDKVGCAIDLVKPGINGYVFKAQNESDLIKNFEEIIKNKKKLMQMGAVAQLNIQDWSFEKICSVIEDQVQML